MGSFFFTFYMHQYMGEAGMAEHEQLFSNQMSLPALDYGNKRILNKTVTKKDYKQINTTHQFQNFYQKKSRIMTPVPET